jgi:hypothetical protein
MSMVQVGCDDDRTDDDRTDDDRTGDDEGPPRRRRRAAPEDGPCVG